MLAIVGLALTVVFYFFPRSDETVTPRERDLDLQPSDGPSADVDIPKSGTRELYVTGGRFVRAPIDEKLLAVCGPSFASNRTDARGCVAAPVDLFNSGDRSGIFVDPCFVVDSTSVACTLNADDEIRRLPTAGPQEVTKPDFSGPNPIWPWAIRLRAGTSCFRRILPDAVPKGADLPVVRPPSADASPTYLCDFYQNVVISEYTLEPDRSLGVLMGDGVSDPAEATQAEFLERRSDGQWSIASSEDPGDPFDRTDVAAAWF